MKFFELIKNIFSRKNKIENSRSFKAAVTNRLTWDWTPQIQSADKVIYWDGLTIRKRARDLYLNNDYVKKYVQLMVNNIVGPDGFIVQNRAKDYSGNFDVAANKLIETAWYDWGMKYCDVQGKNSFRILCEMIMKSLVIDGEIFIRIIKNKNVKYGVQLQLIESDYVDYNLNDTLKNGNHIRMGVEIDKWRKPVAYWFKVVDIDKELNLGMEYTTDYERVSADEVIHLYNQDRPDQTRGISWLASSLLRLKMLGEYEEAAIINARISASKMGFFKSQHSGIGVTSSENIEVEAGTFQELPPGYDFVAFDPKFPSESHGEFVKSMLRGIASGLGVSYNTLANDLEGVNYSSIRAGLLDERDNYKTIQAMVVEKLLIPIYEQWLLMALTKGDINLPLSKFEKFNAPIFYGRRWAWVDPLRDIEASKLAIESGFKTHAEIIAEMGGDLYDTFEQLKLENELKKKYGLIDENNNRSNGKARKKILMEEL